MDVHAPTNTCEPTSTPFLTDTVTPVLGECRI
uniref:Uncharacterized protein n=1 Tax=Peronospora matthiolae TaxID=2874970 RepID=A0AAV1V5X8_9STRA